jgi:tungstate transport system substrate-binding protein
VKALALLMALLATPLAAQNTLVLGATSTTENSGLLAAILPAFTADTGINVNVVALGTRQILALGATGDVDVLIVHHRPSEDAFMAAGQGAARYDLMYNDFIIIGPSADPALVAGAHNAPDAMARIFATQAPFVSRGDESGTHLRELAFWAQAGLSPKGLWYRQVGTGMAASLNIASAMSAYILSDRATWLSFANRGSLSVLFEGGAEMRNTYGLIIVNPALHPHVQAAAAESFANWMLGPQGQAAIAGFRLQGQALFCPISPVIGQEQAKPCNAG